MFKDTILQVKAEINNFRSKNEILKDSVQDKLDYSFDSYCNNVKLICDELSKRNNRRVLKQITRREQDG